MQARRTKERSTQERSAKKRLAKERFTNAQRRSALPTLSEGAFGEELWVTKKVCSSYTRAAEDGATTKVEWRSEVRRNEGASSSMGGGEVNSGVLELLPVGDLEVGSDERRPRGSQSPSKFYVSDLIILYLFL